MYNFKGYLNECSKTNYQGTCNKLDIRFLDILIWINTLWLNNIIIITSVIKHYDTFHVKIIIHNTGICAIDFFMSWLYIYMKSHFTVLS